MSVLFLFERIIACYVIHETNEQLISILVSNHFAITDNMKRSTKSNTYLHSWELIKIIKCCFIRLNIMIIGCIHIRVTYQKIDFITRNIAITLHRVFFVCFVWSETDFDNSRIVTDDGWSRGKDTIHWFLD